MIDVWMELHPKERGYTFCSHPHRVVIQIGLFFHVLTLIDRILKCNLGVKDISDHAGMYLSLHLETEIKQTSLRLNTRLLNDPQCVQFIKN